MNPSFFYMVHHGWFNQFWLMRWVHDLMIQPLVQWLVGSNCGCITSKRPVLGPSLIFQTWGKLHRILSKIPNECQPDELSKIGLKWVTPRWRNGRIEGLKMTKRRGPNEPWLWATRIDFAYSLAWASFLASKKKHELKGKNYPGLSWTCPLRDPKVNNIGNMRHLIGPNTAPLRQKETHSPCTMRREGTQRRLHWWRLALDEDKSWRGGGNDYGIRTSWNASEKHMHHKKRQAKDFKPTWSLDLFKSHSTTSQPFPSSSHYDLHNSRSGVSTTFWVFFQAHTGYAHPTVRRSEGILKGFVMKWTQTEHHENLMKEDWKQTKITQSLWILSSQNAKKVPEMS